MTGFLRFLDVLQRAAFAIASACMVLLVPLILFNVTGRYWFDFNIIGLQELEWYLFSIVFLLSMGYVIRTDGHVRVDMLREKMSTSMQHVFDLLGTFLFVVPFFGLIAYHSLDFVAASYSIGEVSVNPGGLTMVWLIKGLIPVAFIVTLLGALAHGVESAMALKGGEK